MRAYRNFASKDLFVLSAVAFALLFSPVPFAAQGSPQTDLDKQFRSAVEQFDAGQFGDAVVQLELLQRKVPRSFQIQELLGEAYASLPDDAKAVQHLQAAVQLNPSSGPARTNLAATLLHAGRTEAAGEQFRKALALEPKSFAANRNLGSFYLQTGRVADAIQFLECAYSVDPTAYDNGYNLAQADFLTGRLAEANRVTEKLSKEKDSAELHTLIGQIDEKQGRSVEAVNQFQLAAHMEPSEDNLFEWASELLLHATYEPAIDLLERASKMYPNSPRIRIGLGLAQLTYGRYDDAVKSLLAAADLDPHDPRCYQFLSKAYAHSPVYGEEVIERFRRFAEIQPSNAWAQYFYAQSLVKEKRLEGSTPDMEHVKDLLRTSIELDETNPEPHILLGNIYAEEDDFPASIREYLKGIELDPKAAGPYFKLGQDYAHLKRAEDAQKEFALYKQLRERELAVRDNAGVKEFIYTETGASEGHPRPNTSQLGRVPSDQLKSGVIESP